jgi:hypothetical protein
VTAASVLLAEVRAVGAEVVLDDGVLRVRAPKGALTAAQRERLIDHHADIIALLAEPANDRTHRDMSRPVPPAALLADVQAVFAADGPVRQAAAERLAKTRAADSPAGDDLPAWQGWMNRRYAYRRRCGFSRAEALGIVWGEAEWEWHKRHGSRSDFHHCAGCGGWMPAGTGVRLLDGAVVHVDDPEWSDCLIIYGARWRETASAALVALGLRRPS